MFPCFESKEVLDEASPLKVKLFRMLCDSIPGVNLKTVTHDCSETQNNVCCVMSCMNNQGFVLFYFVFCLYGKSDVSQCKQCKDNCKDLGV